MDGFRFFIFRYTWLIIPKEGWGWGERRRENALRMAFIHNIYLSHNQSSRKSSISLHHIKISRSVNTKVKSSLPRYHNLRNWSRQSPTLRPHHPPPLRPRQPPRTWVTTKGFQYFLIKFCGINTLALAPRFDCHIRADRPRHLARWGCSRRLIQNCTWCA